ncbi:MAG: YkgJ family cysteine cluster protein [Myxococcota bacterium]
MSDTDAPVPDPTPRLEGRILALRPLRHACHLCGACCTGWHVRLTDAEEEARVSAQAAELGIADPFTDATLRHEKGRCVFLSDESRCRIHERFGADAKPLVCRQFPRRATLAEDGLRVGVDPSCTSTHLSWVDGPEIQPLVGMQSQLDLTPELAASERGLLGLLSAPDMTFPRAIAIMTGSPPLGAELPVGFVARVLACLRLADISSVFVDPDNGWELRTRIRHLEPCLKELDPAKPPPWEGMLTPEMDAFALEVMRRHLFLRLGDPLLPPIAQALLVAMGVMVSGWASPDEEHFATGLSGWVRLVRVRGVWSRIFPETETARWVLSG